MSAHGDSVEGLQAARRALAARDTDVAAADDAVSAVLREAHDVAAAAITRMDVLGVDLQSRVADQPTGSAAEAREFGRTLVTTTRDIEDIVSGAKVAATAHAAVLRGLIDRYR